MTPQFSTWYKTEKDRDDKTPGLQLETKYQDWTGVHPIGFPKDPKLDESWHPKPSDLKLVHSHQGEWVKVPMERGDHSGPNYEKYNIARLERYVDEDGVVQKAICYQKDGNELNIWFKFDEVMDVYEKWEIPTLPFYYNTKKWVPRMRNEYIPEMTDDNKKAPKYDNGKYSYRKNDSRNPSKSRRNNPDKDDEDRQDRRQEQRYYKDEDYWVRSNKEILDEKYDDPQHRRVGTGRGSVPHDDPREHDYHNTGARPRPQRRRRDSPRRYSDEYRDYSRDRNRDRRYSDRSSSRERGNSEKDRDRKSSYGNKGRY